MHVPIKVDYGVRALIDLAIYGNEGESVRAADTSRRASIPKAYLAQVLHSLRRSGLVKSTRGPNGGHALAIPPDQIRLSDVMDSLDSSENLVQFIWEQIQPRLINAKLYRIRLRETPTIFTDYYGSDS